MSNPKVSRNLTFIGSSQQTSNVFGRFCPDSVIHIDHFTGKAIDATNDYTFSGANSGTATITVPHMLTLTTGGADDDDNEFSMGLEWYGQYNACMEVRFRIDDVDMTAVNIGFNDAQTEDSDDEIAMMYSGETLTASATNNVCLLHDAAATTSNLYFVSVNAGSVGEAVVDSGTLAVDATLYTVRIELVDAATNANARFYLNTSGRPINPGSDLIGGEVAAVPRTTALCPYIALINHGEANANTLDIDYIKIWQDEQ